MSTVEYVVIFDEGVRKRHYHKTRYGEVVEFVVQLEIKIKGAWVPVIRYDCAHKFSHIDRFWADGHKEKVPLDMSFESALSLGDWDIKTNWEKYKEEYFKRR